MVTQPNNQSTAENPVGRFMVAVGAVIELEHTGKFLIIQRTPKLDWHAGEWELLYGRIDQFEDAQQGLLREVAEETGITDLNVGSVLRVWHIFRGPRSAENELIGITFHCRTSQQEVQLSSEHSQYRWVTADEALELIATDGVKEDVRTFATWKNSIT